MEPSRHARTSLVGVLTAIVGVAFAACSDSPTEPDAVCSDPVDMFPTPVSSASSVFSSVDDDFLEVAFRSGFTFSFYGTSYGSVFLNTNGGMTFGAGNDDFDESASSVGEPGIAIFWGDLDAEEYGGIDRANQMAYQACDDRFTVTYTQFQDNDEETWNNTATVTLESDGRIQISYGAVLSEDILVGVFDGTHTDDRYLALASEYTGYDATGTGIILFDSWGPGPVHGGELSGRSVAYSPSGTPSIAAPAPTITTGHEAPVGPKGPKR